MTDCAGDEETNGRSSLRGGTSLAHSWPEVGEGGQREALSSQGSFVDMVCRKVFKTHTETASKPCCTSPADGGPQWERMLSASCAQAWVQGGEVGICTGGDRKL